MTKSPDVWKEYVCHKIFQCCKEFSGILIKRFIAFFADDGYGNIWLVDIKIYDVGFENIEGFNKELKQCEGDWQPYNSVYLKRLRYEALRLCNTKYYKFS
jgi:hypothetical protein